jgi:glycosyltransferase involved in cell wall biosynthesis
MKMIDLTDGEERRGPRVGMVTRFPPSTSASATGSSELAERLVRRYGIPVEVIRLVLPGEGGAATLPVVMDLNPRWHMSAQLAAQRANSCDIALVQIERHIPVAMVDELVSELTIPIVLCIDDVPSAGSEESASLAAIAGRVDHVVVHSDVARRRLESEAQRPIAVEVIPHGSPWKVMEPPIAPRARILTWGFLAPGIGAERVIRALPRLTDLESPPRYRLIGVPDPRWSRQKVDIYRDDLLAQAAALGVANRFELVPIYHTRNGLAAEIAASDLVAVVYDSKDRSASRILTEAVSTGRPVVATAFPGAIEMLATGAGKTVAHDDEEGMARAFRQYLSNEDEYSNATSRAVAISAQVNWDEVARRLAGVLADSLPERDAVVETLP